MRFINTEGYKPRSWQRQVDLKLGHLVGCADRKARGAYLDDARNKIWNIHKLSFERLSHGKCWFSESVASVSDYEIEHFRPKKGVDLIKSKDDYPERRIVSDPDGYWWLSYDLNNLRLAAHKPNQFKGTYFPLETNSIIASPLNNSWLKEKNILLDPCVKKDTELLTYEGIKPVEAVTDVNSIDHIRARVSIKIYALDRFQRLINARATQLQHAKNYFNEANRNWNARRQYMNVNQAAFELAEKNFSNSCGYLIAMLRPDKPFTKMVLAFLKGANKNWIDDFVLEIAKEKKYID